MKEIPVGNFYSGVKRVFGSAKTIVGSAIVAGTGFRDSGSQTETKTKKKNMEAAEEKSGVQNSYVTIVMGKKAPKKVKLRAEIDSYYSGLATLLYQMVSPFEKII